MGHQGRVDKGLRFCRLVRHVLDKDNVRIVDISDTYHDQTRMVSGLYRDRLCIWGLGITLPAAEWSSEWLGTKVPPKP